jgi:cell division protein FtsW
MLIIINLPPDSIRKSVIFIVVFSFILSVIVLLSGKDIQGARRWIIVGNISFQPSEIVKLALILYLADILSKKGGELDLYKLSHPVVVVFVFALLTFAQNDFSTAIFLIFISAVLFFISGVKMRYFAAGFALFIPILLILLFSKEHRVKRIIAFLDPEFDPSGVSYQIIKAKEALVDGGFWGKGIGNGYKKFGTIPEAHSDFIFAAMGEEIGFIGVFTIITLFVVFAIIGYKISFRCRNKFIFYTGFGITTAIFYQAMMNMAVVAGILPSTGITLPFFSHGGSSIFVTLIMCALLLNFSRYSEYSEKEKETM